MRQRRHTYLTGSNPEPNSLAFAGPAAVRSRRGRSFAESVVRAGAGDADWHRDAHRSAPLSGVVVQVQSSNTLVAQVPATVSVVGGQSSATFTINTSSVGASSPVTITANFGGAARSATLTVTPPALEAAFSVTSPTRGNDACLYGPGRDEADCVLDASASRGPIDRYIWTYWTGGAVIGHSTPQAQSALQLDSECRFFDNARGGDDANGNRYIQMTVELVLQDRNNVRTSPVRRAVLLYPNRLCGFAY